MEYNCKELPTPTYETIKNCNEIQIGSIEKHTNNIIQKIEKIEDLGNKIYLSLRSEKAACTNNTNIERTTDSALLEDRLYIFDKRCSNIVDILSEALDSIHSTLGTLKLK